MGKLDTEMVFIDRAGCTEIAMSTRMRSQEDVDFFIRQLRVLQPLLAERRRAALPIPGGADAIAALTA